MYLKRLSLLVLFVLLFRISYPQESIFTPRLSNYSYQQYGAGTANWDILEDDRGLLYFANNQGVLEYDGSNWTLIESPDQEVARSFAKDDEGKIYVGFVGDLGYLAADEKGAIHFVSLRSKLPPEFRFFKEVWRTHFFQGAIYYQTRHHLFRWDGSEMKVLNPGVNIQFSWIANDQLFVGLSNKGLFQVNGSALQLAPNGDQFADKRIYTILPFDDNKYLVGTRKAGLMIWDGQEVQPFETEIPDAFVKQLYLPGLSFGNGQFLLNTVGNGAIQLNAEGQILNHFNEESGLQDNTVNYTYLDSKGTLWLALFNGISAIHLPSPFRYLKEDTGLPSKTVNDLELHNGNLYAGTINGVFVLNDKGDKFVPVNGTFGQVYQLFRYRNRLFAAGWSMGFFEIVGREIKYITKNANDNFKTTMIRASSRDARRIFTDWQDGLVSFYFDESTNNFVEESRTTAIRPRYKGFEEDQEGNIWTIGFDKGTVICLKPEFSNGKLDLKKSKVITYDSSHGLPSDLKLIFKTDGALDFLGRQVFGFDSTREKFYKKTNAYEEQYRANTQFFSYPYIDPNDRVWLQAGKGIAIMHPALEVTENITLPFQPIRGFPVWNILVAPQRDQSNTLAYFNGPEGIIRYEGNPRKTPAAKFATYIRKISYTPDSILYAGTAALPKVLKLRQNDEALIFEYSSPFNRQSQALKYQTKLEGLEESWSSPSISTQQSYANLPFGKYSFNVKAINSYNQESEIATVHFVVEPNWWQSRWMKLLYALMLLTGLVLIVRYWTNRKTRRLEEKQIELESLVKKRTAQIEKDKAIIQKQAEELAALDQLKSRFFANISHELRTPLTLILGPLSYLIDTPEAWDKEEIQRQLLVMQRNGKSLLQLIEEILDLSKLEANKLELKEEATPLVQFFENLFFVFEPQFQAKGISYELRLNFPEQLSVIFDRRKLEKVVNNYLSNATKFTPRGGRIILSVNEHEEQILIHVSDSGPGIHPDDLPHIFERFFQSKQADQALYGGTGIGLALVREFAQLMGGKAWADSKLGTGSNFYFSFPRRAVAIESTLDKITMEDFEDEPIYSLGTDFTILVVEDNPDMRAFISQLLRQKYSQVLTASNGAEGLALLEEKATSIDLIVSDVMMPEVDGLELLERVKMHSEWYSIPVIMLTALAAERDKLKALTIGVDDYLTKPFSVPELTLRVQNLLFNYQQRKEAVAKVANSTSVKPDIKTASLQTDDKTWIDDLKQKVNNALKEQTLSVEFLASSVFLSPRQLNRKVKSITGLTPARFIKEVQLQTARTLLENGEVRSITDLAYQCGYEHSTTLSTLFKKRFGKSPSDYFKGL